MFDWLYELLGTMLYGFSRIFQGKYVFGLLIYAILFKILFLPFSIKQQKNQIKMAKLAPKIELIKAKYKGRTDQPTLQKQQQEIMELQQKEGYSPLAGCGPMLLQMPIIIFLYKVIRNPISYICRVDGNGIKALAKAALDKGVIVGTKIADTAAELDALTGKNIIKNIDQIKLLSAIEEHGISIEGIDLSRRPDLELFNFNLGNNPSGWLLIIPVLAAALTWLSMFLSRRWNANPTTEAQGAQANASMKMMDLLMPAMTLFMALPLSCLMGVYWIYQSILGIIQIYLISKAMPLPKYTEQELKEMKKAQKEAEKAARSAAKNAPKYRSLHYIDDEDYETLPELETDGKNDKKNTGELEITEI